MVASFFPSTVLCGTRLNILLGSWDKYVSLQLLSGISCVWDQVVMPSKEQDSLTQNSGKSLSVGKQKERRLNVSASDTGICSTAFTAIIRYLCSHKFTRKSNVRLHLKGSMLVCIIHVLVWLSLWHRHRYKWVTTDEACKQLPFCGEKSILCITLSVYLVGCFACIVTFCLSCLF